MTTLEKGQDTDRSISGIVIGLLINSEQGVPYVIFAQNAEDSAIPAKSLASLSVEDVGKQVALAFEDGDVARPIILGKIVDGLGPPRPPRTDFTSDDIVDLSAESEITIRCGKASITLTHAGKIILRGTYISSRSSGMSRIKGGSVQIN